ncbi:carboxymuconolactone decarboxylase family protein [Candidatus Nitronereus thalassa]|uniref:Carboxymuconolactone decarboxylase family protein n=1 Tax=Candidatus Nitronereus thalassa TaxID=3020898 RepID=A0ABU3K7D4_9BACT|nr:carboxymuconolactone decarboxylase family protein [Candidatus Nitronereus thalassa]MDT7042288.1 carboxymuconolactone decarboxylase family protein [Candidatus Nitronereus thalassa]
MATVKLVEEAEAAPEIQHVYEEVKKTFGVPFVPNIFKAMANHPGYLEVTWSRFKVIMGPGKLDPKTKQVIALAVSATNNCEYCVNAHSAALKQMGYDDAALTELMAVVDMFNGFNKFLDGLRVESDLKP